MWRFVFAMVTVTLFEPMADAQTFRPRGEAQAHDMTATQENLRATRAISDKELPAQSNSSVSQDLLQIYAQTKTAQSETELTTIARACAKALSDSSRTDSDHAYAQSLFAWALNRRGEIRSEQASELVQAGKFDSASKLDSQAADDFATAVKYSPKHWRHRHNYAVSLAMKGDYVNAISQLDEAIKLNPNYANARFNRAELHFELGDYDAADRDYTAAIELSKDAQYYNGRAHCRFMLEAHPEALSDYRRAAELAGNNAVYHTDLADAYQFLGRWEDAAKAYRAAVAADNRYARAYQNAAWLMATCPDDHIRNTELAVSAAKKAMELTGSRSIETVETLAVATAALGRHQEARRLQEEALQLASRDKNVPEDQLNEIKQRLALYQKDKAYLQPQPTQPQPPSGITRTASTK